MTDGDPDTGRRPQGGDGLLPSLRGRLAGLLGEEHAGRLLTGGATSLVIKVATMGTALGAEVAAARLLGAQAFGEYAYVISWLTLLLVLARFGYDTAAVRFVAAYRGTEPSKVNAFAAHSRRRVLQISTLLALAGGAAVWIARPWLTPTLTWGFWIACLALPVAAWMELWSSFLQGAKRVVAARLPRGALRHVVFLALLGGAILVDVTSTDARLGVAAYLGAMLVALGVQMIAWQRTSPEATGREASADQRRHWDRVAFTLVLVTSVAVLMRQVDVIMIGPLRSTTEAGIYAVAKRVAEIVLFGISAMNIIAAPTFSDLAAADRRAELQRAATVATTAVTLFTLPIAAALVVLGPFLLGLFGPAFPAGYTSLILLVAGMSVNALVGSVGFLMTMTGRERTAAIVTGLAAVLNVGLNLALIPRWGIEGAAAATAISMGVLNLIMYLRVRKELGIDPSILSLSSRWRPSA